MEKTFQKYLPALPLAIGGTLLYLAAGIIWIFLSDNILEALVRDRPELTMFQTYKGLFFVFTTGLILFLIITGYTKRVHDIEEKFRKTIEEVKDYAVYILDTDGNIVTWNKGAENISGYSSDEIMGKNHSIFFTDEEKRNGVPDEHLRISAARGRLTSEGIRVRKGGSYYYAIVTTTSLHNDKGVITGYLKIVYDLTERKKAEEEIIQNRQQIRNLMEHLESVREEERVSISREIHDELGQMLTSIKIDLSLLAKDSTLNEGIQDRITRMKQKIDSLINTVRKISAGLRPNELDFFGIEATIESELYSLKESTGLVTSFTSNLGGLQITNNKATMAIYRIFKEALTNILRHADAAGIFVNLSFVSTDLVLEISDNGKGFDSSVISAASYGIIGMKERAAILGGSLQIESQPGKGCRIKLTVPHSRLNQE